MNGWELTAVFAVVGGHMGGSENPYQGELAGDTESLGQKSAGIFAKI
jgi:hypothetical protein